MHRESDKHSPRVDDEMKLETDSMTQGAPVGSRAEERREKEPYDLRPDAVEQRSEIARFLQPDAFPGEREALVSSAREMDAPAGVLRQLERLPDGETFRNVQDIWVALGGEPEHNPGHEAEGR